MKNLDKTILDIDMDKVKIKIIDFLVDEVVRKRKKKGVVVGVSGGVDSAISLILSVEAFGKENVFAVLLPEGESSKEGLVFGENICKSLDVEYEIIDMTKSLSTIGIYEKKNLLLKELFVDYNQEAHNTAMVFSNDLLTDQKITFPRINFYEGESLVKSVRLSAVQYNHVVSLQNVKQRLRMIYIYQEAEKRNFIVVGTTNKTELLLGQFVKFGDGGVDLEPLADLFKTQIYALAKHIGVSEEIIERPPSPDTWSHYTSDEDFYWRMPLSYLDELLYAWDNGYSSEKVAVNLELEKEKIERIFENFESIKKSTDHIAKEPPSCEINE